VLFKVIMLQAVRNYQQLVRNKPEQHILSANVSGEMADWHIGPPYNRANKHHGQVEELLFHTREIPGSILGLEVANLKFIYDFISPTMKRWDNISEQDIIT
jgi:hypothetical protein